MCVAFCYVFEASGGAPRCSCQRAKKYPLEYNGRHTPPPTLARLSPSSARSIAGAPRVNTVKYNRFHDQLLVSGSSDCMVHLWRVSSVSSAPLLEPEDEDAVGLDRADGGEFDGSSGGSKGEAADIRVSVLYSARESARATTGLCRCCFVSVSPTAGVVTRCSFLFLLRSLDVRLRGT